MSSCPTTPKKLLLRRDTYANWNSVDPILGEGEIGYETDTGAIKIDRVVVAADCGILVNPDAVAAQMEGSVIFALGAALLSEITFKNGLAEQANFLDYPILRYAEAPVIEVHLVESRDPPGGAGEPGVPPVAPAIANAVFAATGRRIRSLPIRLAQ